MTISEVAQQIVDTKNAHLVRYRKDSVKTHGVAQYDCKPLFTGSHRHWTMIDHFTASALAACYKGLRPENQPKFNNLPIGKLVEICFRSVA